MPFTAEFFDGRDTARVHAVQRLRKSLFVEGCGWCLETVGDREVDAFDTDDTVHLVLSRDAVPCATFRAVRTDRPYLSQAVFPQLAVISPYPRRRDAWEISRFGTVPGSGPEAAAINYALMFRFAQDVGATALVATADPVYERYLRSIGIRTRRYGPITRVGATADGRGLFATAGEIPIALQTPESLAALARLLQTVEISDASALLGPARLSA